MRPSERKLKQYPPINPDATVSTSYAAVFAGLGARVCPSHAGMGAYPSVAALPSAGFGGPGSCAGGRGITRGDWAGAAWA